MLAEGPIQGVTYFPRYNGPGEGWRITTPIKHLNGLGRLGAMGGDSEDAVTLWSVMNGRAYSTLKQQERDLMNQGAQIQSMLLTATGSDVQALNDAWNYNSQAKQQWAQASAAYNKVVELINTYTDAYNIPYHPSSLSGLGIVGEVEIPAIVYTVLALAGVSAAIYALIQASSHIPALTNSANQLMATVGKGLDTTATGIRTIPAIFEAGSDAFAKVALVAGVGAVGYMLFRALQKKGHI